MGRRTRRLGRVVLLLLGLLTAIGLGLALLLRNPLPAAEPGPEGDALARRIERAVGVDAWTRTGAIRWRMYGAAHLWDRRRQLARVSLGERQVLLDLRRGGGLVLQGGRPLQGAAAARAIERGLRRFYNDSFWLNPLAKLFDPGVTRSRVTVEGQPALLVHYTTGGVTPGDRYLWLLDAQDRPRAWRLWVQVLPIPGVELSWAGWRRLSTGAWISTSHRVRGLEVMHLEEVAAAATLSELEPGPDPFAAILAPSP